MYRMCEHEIARCVESFQEVLSLENSVSVGHVNRLVSLLSFPYDQSMQQIVQLGMCYIVLLSRRKIASDLE